MHARQRRPTIRKVRDCDWERAEAVSLRPPRVPLDLLPSYFDQEPPTPRKPTAINDLYDNEEEKRTLARFVPLKSDVHEIFDDPETTLAYIRKVQQSIPDPDSALDSLVAVYEDRVARIAAERAKATEIVVRANIAAEDARDAAAMKKPPTRLDRAVLKLQPHFWKIVYSTICVWGLVQLALTR